MSDIPDKFELGNYTSNSNTTDPDLPATSAYRYGVYWDFIQSLVDIAEKNTLIITTDSYQNASGDASVTLNDNVPVISVSGGDYTDKGLTIDFDQEYEFQDIVPPNRVGHEMNQRNYEKEMGHIKNSPMNMPGLALDVAGFRSNTVRTTNTLRIPVKSRTTPGPNASPNQTGPIAYITDLTVTGTGSTNEVEIQTQLKANVDDSTTSLDVNATFKQYKGTTHDVSQPLKTQTKTVSLSSDPNSDGLIGNKTLTLRIDDSIDPGDIVFIRQELENYDDRYVAKHEL